MSRGRTVLHVWTSSVCCARFETGCARAKITFQIHGLSLFLAVVFRGTRVDTPKTKPTSTLLHAVPVNHDYRIYLSSASQDALSSPLVVAFVLSFTTVTPRSAPRRVSVMSCPTRRIWFPVIAGMTLCCRAPPTVLIACVLGVFM